MYKIKLEAIERFLEPYKNQPRQGSEAWKAMRGIGGSELNMLLKDEKRLVGQKVGLVRGMSDGILSCNWGSVLEATLRDITSRVLCTPIFEATSIPSVEVRGKTYSMDGMGVVRYFCDEVNGRRYPCFMWLTTLFEYKCPFTREIRPGEIYADYIPQVLSGMSDLAIPEIALYVEGVFRISRFEELANTAHVEDWLHCSANPRSWLHRSGNPRGQLPMCYGFLAFYMRDAVVPEDAAFQVAEWIRHGNVDFAKLENPAALNTLLRCVRQGLIETWQSAITYQPREWRRCDWFAAQRIPVHARHVDMDREAIRFQRECIDRGHIPLGILGYKLLDLNVVPIEKEPGYTKKYEAEITGALARVQALKQIEDPGMRMLEYNRIYGIDTTPTGQQEDNTQALDDLLI